MKITIKDINEMSFDNRLKFLTEHEKDIFNMKKATIKYCDNMVFSPVPVKSIESSKAAQIVENEVDKIHVKVVANIANYIDSQLDMLLVDSWKKSITERLDLIWHMKDHLHTSDSKVGEVTAIYGQTISLLDLGFSKVGQTQALIFETDILKDYDEKIFNVYKNRGIKNHSISLAYVNLALAVNNKDNPLQYKNWETYLPLAINPQVAQENGYFFVVKEERILENSCVWRGANDITPTLETIEISNSSDDLPQKAQIKNIEPQKNALDYEQLINNILTKI
jgi:hypothetical protein